MTKSILPCPKYPFIVLAGGLRVHQAAALIPDEPLPSVPATWHLDKHTPSEVRRQLQGRVLVQQIPAWSIMCWSIGTTNCCLVYYVHQ
jgi:hypothetical protein